MKKTLKVGYGEKAEKVTIESTGKKLYGTAVWKGYVSVKNNEEPKPYEGRFGKGYTVKSHNSESTRFCFITYYVA